MFKIIKQWLFGKSLMGLDAGVVSPVKTEKVDERAHASVKRFRKSFEAQQQQMQVRAMKAHDPSCKEPDICKKRKCFKWESDKIVSESYEVPPRS